MYHDTEAVRTKGVHTIARICHDTAVVRIKEGSIARMCHDTAVVRTKGASIMS